MTANQDTEIKLKPRKRPLLWQAYLHWDELVEMRKRHTNRLSAITRGASNLDATFERNVMEHMQIDTLLNYAEKTMVGCGKVTAGAIWPWITGIRGLGAGGLAAQLIAQIDDIGNYPNVSKLWRFCGYGLYEYWQTPGGKIVAPLVGWQVDPEDKRKRIRVRPEPSPNWTIVRIPDRGVTGWLLPYNRRLKSVCYLVTDQFIKQQTPAYVDFYYAAKEEERRLHPDLSLMHTHRRAMRKTTKLFLQHLWSVWREAEDLPVTLPYAHAILGHTNYVAPLSQE